MFDSFSNSKVHAQPSHYSLSSSLTPSRSLTRFNPESLNNPTVSRSSLNEGYQPEYVPFNDLPTLAENCDLDQLLAHIRERFLDKDNWVSQFEAITDLRSLYRNLPDRVNLILQCFCGFLIAALTSHKSATVKNALVAFSDFYEHAVRFPIDYQYTHQILNHLISKSMSPSVTLKTLSERAINNLIASNPCDSLLQQLCELSANHNLKAGALGFQYLAVALNSFQNSIEGFQDQTNQMIFKTMAFVVERQSCGKLKLVARNIVKFYRQKMGDEGFQKFLRFLYDSNCMSKEEIETVWQTATKSEKINYPRLSTQLPRMRQSMMG